MTREEIEGFMKSQIAAALNQEPEDIDEETNFLKIGISSVQALKIINRTRKHLQVDISPVALFEYKTITEFASYLHESLLQGEAVE
ncbi:acyl carrier protein [Paenibacillus silvae]|jgi:acyl carrier protein|uniref:Acyl carrier protein n=1 Tax=Paenibacillus silvae TaxID=1325358 RepID=A0A2W6PDJ8_9BACL|nr:MULTISPECIES: acyl carrier protein [Paenibacillus]MBU5354103.1 acyl carrier protein [Paenibacillus barcinonensis]MCK6075311.1 acyl carrier protein [Paenibacillus silvae]MCK6149698.1 acyl carrier protein [Paenibacillus silvae]MCK6267996.1 acyl carrier protein [Paenibacillus silvae]MDM5276363.1 acyl carrier protein [Paenibacillus silvae]